MRFRKKAKRQRKATEIKKAKGMQIDVDGYCEHSSSLHTAKRSTSLLALKGHVAFTAVLAVLVFCHKDSSTTTRVLALLSCTFHLERSVIFLCDLKVLQSAHLFELVAVGGLLRLGEDLLLLLLALTALNGKHRLHSSFGLNAIGRERGSILQKTSAVEEIGSRCGDERFHIRNGFTATQTESHRLASQVLDEDLHS